MLSFDFARILAVFAIWEESVKGFASFGINAETKLIIGCNIGKLQILLQKVKD